MNQQHSSNDAVIAYAKIWFQFWGNNDVEYSERALRSLAKNVIRECKISATPLPDGYNPEQGSMLICFSASTKAAAQNQANKVMEYLEQKSEARITSDEWSYELISFGTE